MTTTSAEHLQDLFEDLAATPASRLPYQQNVLLRSFILKRDTGNVIVYNSPGVNDCSDEILELGQPVQMLISHDHESMHGRPDLDVPIWVHEGDRAGIEAAMPVAGAFADDVAVDDDLRAIPTPSHTEGTKSYLWDSGTHRYLFTGDFIWIEDGEWKAVVLDERLREDYVTSLELVRELDFDVLVPWGVTEGDDPAFVITDDDDRRERLTRIIDRVAAGGSR